MRTILPAMYCFLFSAIAAHAQTKDVEDQRHPLQQRSVEFGSILIEPPDLIDLTGHAFPSESAKPDNRRNLPDMPLPKSQTDRDQPGPDESGKQSGKSSYPSDYDPLHLNQPDRSWPRAMAHPIILLPDVLLVGLTVVQLRKTDRCIDDNKTTCNLVFRKNRAATYAFNIPFTTAVVWLTGRMKQKGNGMGSVILSTLSLMYEAPVAYTANPKVLTCQAGRNPQCQ